MPIMGVRLMERAVYHDGMQIAEALTKSHLPKIDAEMLLGHILSKPRSWIIAHENDTLETHTFDEFEAIAKRRRGGEPMSYITGVKEFYGREFLITPAVLIPRPATEELIDLTKEFLRERNNETREIDTGIVGISRVLCDEEPTIILDIGTGSGCIAITLALEGLKQEMIGVDISADAITVAKKNAQKHGVTKQVTFLHANGADIIESMQEPFLIVSNPPYIPEKTTLEKTVRDYEPHSSLFAGLHGLDVIHQIVQSAVDNAFCTGLVIECREDQATEVIKQ